MFGLRGRALKMAQYYVVYDSAGHIITRYDSDIHSDLIANPPIGLSLLEVPDQATMLQTCEPGWAVINGTLTAPTAAKLLAQAQQAQIATLAMAYQAAIVQPASYTSKGGVTKTYQADPGSLSNLQNTLLGLQAAGATPSGFYWVAADNTQVPFTYADLQGLAAALLAQGWAAFQKLQTLKSEVNAATTVSAVQAVVWS
jgi:hypothetical protein